MKAAIEIHQAEIVEFLAHDFAPQNIRLCRAAGLQLVLYSNLDDKEQFKVAPVLSMDLVNIDHIGQTAPPG